MEKGENILKTFKLKEKITIDTTVVKPSKKITILIGDKPLITKFTDLKDGTKKGPIKTFIDNKKKLANVAVVAAAAEIEATSTITPAIARDASLVREQADNTSSEEMTTEIFEAEKRHLTN